MKVVVFGASGKTGIEVCKKVVEKGYQTTGFDLIEHKDLRQLKGFTFVQGNVLNLHHVKQVVKEVDAVVSVLGVKIGNGQPVVSEGNKNIIRAMQANHVRRLIVQSAFGAQESWQPLPFHYKLLHKFLLGSIATDKDRMEQVVMASSLNWTIIRPVRLTGGPARGIYRTGDESIELGLNPRISRKDTAICIVDTLQNGSFVHQAITIVY